MDDMSGGVMVEAMERLAAVASLLETLVEQMTQQQIALSAAAEGTVSRIVATVEGAREQELMRKLAEAEAKIAELSASAGRKTVSTGAAAMLEKRGLALESVDAGALDAALNGLSVEQRIAVKAELLRAGLV